MEGKVERGKDGSIAAALYQSDGTTLTEGQKSSTTRKEGKAIQNLESDKTASVVNEADRVFQKIELSASTKGRDERESQRRRRSIDARAGRKCLYAGEWQETEGHTGCGKSLCEHDEEISHQRNCRDDISGDQRIIFDDYGPVDFIRWIQSDNVDAINRFINKNASGGTPMGDALEEANSILSGRRIPASMHSFYGWNARI